MKKFKSWLEIANSIYQDDSIPENQKDALILDCKEAFDNQVSGLTIPNIKVPVLPVVAPYDEKTLASMKAAQVTIDRLARDRQDRIDRTLASVSPKIRRMLEIMMEEGAE